MSFTKTDIVKNISKKTSISNQSAIHLLDNFLRVVVSASFKGPVKICNFGTFERKKTPSRIGRNPKTGEEFSISERIKLNLVLSNKIKEKIN
jgi:integration host factor subunit alpha